MMKKALNLFRDYWYIPFFILFMILGWIVFRRRDVTPLEHTKRELKAIQASREIKELIIHDGISKARLKIIAKYMSEKEQFSKDQQIKAERLKHDPVALSKFLVRAGSKR